MAIVVGTLTTLLSSTTEWGASGLANNGYSNASSAYDNRTNLNMFADFELAVTFATSPTANTSVDIYIVPSVDNSTFADGGGAVAPPGSYYAGSFVVRNVNTAQRIACIGVPIPPDQFKVVILNNATGQTIPATSTVKMSPYSIG